MNIWLKSGSVAVAFACFCRFSLAGSESGTLAKREDEKALTEIERKWCNSYVTNDADYLDSLMAGTYVQTSASGRVSDKTEEVTFLRNPAFQFTKFDPSDLRIDLYGGAAIVTGQISAQGRDTKTGKTSEGRMRMTDTFVRRDGKWVLVASQTVMASDKSPVAAQSSPRSGKAKIK